MDSLAPHTRLVVATVARVDSLPVVRNLKTLLFLHFILRRSLKAWRHVRARGLRRTVRELYIYAVRVRRFCPAFLEPWPSLRLHVDAICSKP